MGFLDRVKSGVLHEALVTLVYGVDGIGKSSFGAEAPSPLFLGAEHGTGQMDVARLPEPRSFQEVRDMVSEVAASPGKYKSLVIDSLDWLEPLIWTEVCIERKVKSITQIGFNKGFEAAVEKTRQFIAQLNEVKAKGLHIILLAHARVKTFQDPAATSGYDRYQLAMRDDSGNVWRQYADAVLFANYVVYKESDDTRRAQGSGERMFFTEERPAFQAKNRFSLPFQIPMVKGKMWTTYYALATGKVTAPAGNISDEIEQLKSNVTDVVVLAKVEKAVSDAKGDAVKLQAIKTKLVALTNGGAK